MIETQRLILRPYTLEDFADYWSMLTDYAREVSSQQMPARDRPSQEEAWQHVMAAAGHWSLFGYGVFAVVDRATGAYIGETGLVNMRREMGDRFIGCDEAGWHLKAHAQGRGLAFEAAEAAHAWYAQHFGERRTFCLVDSLDVRSIRLATKLGYEVFDLQGCGGYELLIFERPSRPGRHGSFYHAADMRASLH